MFFGKNGSDCTSGIFRSQSWTIAWQLIYLITDESSGCNMVTISRLCAFHNSAKIKAGFIEQVSGHVGNDQIQWGQYYHRGPNCTMGCTVPGYHGYYETALGIPCHIALIEDRIFERLPPELSAAFLRDTLHIIPLGADLSVVPWLLYERMMRTLALQGAPDCRDSMLDLCKLLTDFAKGIKFDGRKGSELSRSVYRGLSDTHRTCSLAGWYAFHAMRGKLWHFREVVPRYVEEQQKITGNSQAMVAVQLAREFLTLLSEAPDGPLL
jgi:hypothetical protein